jgi:hypothetical protein
MAGRVIANVGIHPDILRLNYARSRAANNQDTTLTITAPQMSATMQTAFDIYVGETPLYGHGIHTMRITNNGAGAIDLSNLTLDLAGPGAGFFATIPSLSGILLPGEYIEFAISVAAPPVLADVGNYDAALTISCSVYGTTVIDLTLLIKPVEIYVSLPPLWDVTMDWGGLASEQNRTVTVTNLSSRMAISPAAIGINFAGGVFVAQNLPDGDIPANGFVEFTLEPVSDADGRVNFPPGTHPDTLRITFAGAVHENAITLTINPREFYVTHSLYEFNTYVGEAISSEIWHRQTITIENANALPVSYSDISFVFDCAEWFVYDGFDGYIPAHTTTQIAITLRRVAELSDVAYHTVTLRLYAYSLLVEEIALALDVRPVNIAVVVDRPFDPRHVDMEEGEDPHDFEFAATLTNISTRETVNAANLTITTAGTEFSIVYGITADISTSAALTLAPTYATTLIPGERTEPFEVHYTRATNNFQEELYIRVRAIYTPTPTPTPPPGNGNNGGGGNGGGGGNNGGGNNGGGGGNNGGGNNGGGGGSGGSGGGTNGRNGNRNGISANQPAPESYYPPTPDYPPYYTPTNANLLIIPIDSNRIHRVARTYDTANGYRHNTTLEVHQDVYTWLAETESTMVSVRFVAYALGLDVIWCPETRTAFVDPYGYNLTFTYGQKHMYAAGTAIPLLNAHGIPVETYLINNRLMVPLRPFGNAIKQPVNWNPHTRTAYLYITNGEDTNPAFEIEIVRIPVTHDVFSVTRRNTQNGAPELIHLFDVNGRPGWIATYSPMIPLRFAAYALGLDIEWNPQTLTATIDPHGKDIRFTQGQNLMRRNGYYMPIRSVNGEFVSAAISENHMFATPRALGEALGLPVGWNANTQTAFLYVVPRHEENVVPLQGTQSIGHIQESDAGTFNQ